MDAALRQSKAMCPFMKKATAAGLRAMTTAARPAFAASAPASATTAVAPSPCGGTISKLQVLARRCPVMGKALAVQSARLGPAGFPAGVASVAGYSTLSGQQRKSGKAKLHTGRPREAQAVEGSLFRDKGELLRPHWHRGPPLTQLPLSPAASPPPRQAATAAQASRRRRRRRQPGHARRRPRRQV
jgi:5-aminolevulinate synthase